METSLITLYGRAIDAGRNPTVLGDAMAAATMRRADYDVDRLKRGRWIWRGAAARAKHLDDWTRQFLAATTGPPSCTWAAGWTPDRGGSPPGPR
jgi:O-methyltransferase involved in polyketide biosynthesis